MKQILARKTIKHGHVRWRVIVPLDLRKENGKKHFFFAEESEALDFVKKLKLEREKETGLFRTLSHADQALMLSAYKLAGGDAHLVLMAVMQVQQKQTAITSKTIRSVLDEYMVSKRNRGVRHKSMQNIEGPLYRFAAAIGTPSIALVTTKMIEDWLNSNGWGDNTRKSYLNHVNSLFLFAVQRDYIHKNPAAGVPRPKVEAAEIGIHTVDQVRLLMKTIMEKDPGLIGHVALLYFGGIRPQESKRLSTDDLRDTVIEVNPKKAKGRRRRFSFINPTLRAWLNYPGAQIGGTNIRKRLEAIRAGLTSLEPKYPLVKIEINGKTAWRLPWPHDVLRHTFCSYAIPKYGAKDVAEWAGNSEKILYSNYRERVRSEDVEAFWAITPESLK